MGTISDKLTYLNTTKSQLKDMINYGLDEDNKITSSTTFRNYVSSIFNAFLEALRNPDTLFTNLPKITGSGSNITLNGTANAPMRIELGASELTRAGTLTPSSPQDIHTISGSNKVKVIGKNFAPLLTNETQKNVSISQEGNTLTINGTSSGGADCTPTIFNLKAGTYTYSSRYISGSIGDNISLIMKNLSTNQDVMSITYRNNTYQNDGNITFTLTEETTIKFYVYFGSSGRVYDNYKINYQLTKSDNADYNFKPYVSQEADIDLDNISLFDKNNANILNASFTNVDITSSSNAKTLYVPIIGGKSYIINKIQSARFRVGTTQNIPVVNGTIIDYAENNNAKSIPILTSKNANYLLVYYFLNGTDTLTEQEILNSISIYDMATYNSLLPLEYCKIGNYEDKFIRNSGKNLFDYKTMTLDNMNFNTGSLLLATDNSCKLGYIKCEPNTTYTISRSKIPTNDRFQIATTEVFPQVGVSTSAITYGVGTYATITTSSTAQYIVVRFIYNEVNDYESYASTIQIEKGSTATEYEPYGTNEWYIKKNIGKVVLDGTEDWLKQWEQSTPNMFIVMNLLSDSLRFSSATPNIICKSTHFVSVSYDSGDNSMWRLRANDDYPYLITITDNASSSAVGSLLIKDTQFTTLNDFKTWLANNNVLVYYMLNTPTYTKITGTLAEQLENVYQKMLSQNGQTNISQVNNDLSFEMSVSALEDIG